MAADLEPSGPLTDLDRELGDLVDSIEPTEIGPTDVVVPTFRSQMTATVIGAVGALAVAITCSKVGSSSGLWVSTSFGCVVGVCLGVAAALEPFETKISPWYVGGGLLRALGVALVSGLGVVAGNSGDATASTVAWVLGWTGLVFGALFWLVSLPMLVRARRRVLSRWTNPRR